MTRIALPLVLFLIYSSTLFADCKQNLEVLGAKYKVTNLVAGADNKTKSTRHVVLWRNGQQVAHEYSDTRVTELWEQTGNGMLRLVRYFDDYARGIEYQPNEVETTKKNETWKLKQQLVSDELIKSMQLKATTGRGCNKLQSYLLKTDNKTITLQWFTHQHLIKSYIEESRNHTKTWELEQTIIEPDRVKEAFSSRSDYQTTDYADIGDNESDPFLMKMINLGFVEHSASGFYDSQGNAMEGHHHH